ncbi:ubiquitin-protein ligase E3 [Schizosaccharomyces cryophilus OY26]|uniref:Ubiquitin-protein ligase E3 n=1 Tax=Schizosaccharomyces cryophilus (strain OY26 / ATCC MYA-4695 / CBS 11777 / NBRC 106824 / NRRL Y48691) TaxID=653667 RepID=S9W0N0_SCHCR|nr:ubiquitin-protein ligase E3 [Schizosaccharomyces cryophilus OY26]EPY51610.1 ubiquitin-protein ligase E3 [Schizosaccharomyces cryophilus OY26]
MENSCVDKRYPLRCWICYDEFDGVRNPKDPWRRPCKCSLIAHESCLVSYVTSSTNTRCPQCLNEYIIARPMKANCRVLHAVGLCQNIESGLVQIALGTGVCLGIGKSVYSIFRETGLWVCRQVADESSMLFVMQRPLFSSAILPILPCMLVRFCEAPSYDIVFSLFTHCSVYYCVDRFSTTQILLCALPWIRSIHKELTNYIKKNISVYTQEDDEELRENWLRKLDDQIEQQNLVTNEDAEVKHSELWTFFSVFHTFLDGFTTEILRILRPIVLLPLAGKFLGRLFPNRLTKVQKSILGAVFALCIKDICRYSFLSWRAKRSQKIRILDNQIESKH